jgi:hypothetical protein
MGVALSSFEWGSIWLIFVAVLPLSWRQRFLGKRQFRKVKCGLSHSSRRVQACLHVDNLFYSHTTFSAHSF